MKLNMVKNSSQLSENSKIALGAGLGVLGGIAAKATFDHFTRKETPVKINATIKDAEGKDAGTANVTVQ